MNDYIVSGYAAELFKEEADSRHGYTWYLPHYGVINPNKSKVRMVYDAGAEYGGTSPNEELLQGPQLNNSLIGVLFRLRKDVSSKFHRVGCAKEDTDALQFLWWTGSMGEPPNYYKMTVHLFGKADSPCIAAWALTKKARDNELEFGRHFV